MDWIKTPLKAFQASGVEQAVKYKRFVLCFDAGTGKTLASLAAFAHVRELIHQDYLCVVLAPKTAIATWVAEIPLHTNFTFSEHDIRKDRDVLLVSYSQLEKNLVRILELLQSHHRVMLVLDEAHVLRSRDSNLAVLLRKVIMMFPRVYALTATPMMNHIEDTYFLYSSLFPGIFGELHDFMNRYTIRQAKEIRRHGKKAKIWEIVEYRHLDELKATLEKTMYRYSQDYNLEFRFESSPLTAPEMDRYFEVAQGVLTASKTLRDFVQRLPSLQLCVNNSDPRDDGSPDLLRRPLSSKEQLLMRVLADVQSRNEAVIIFTNFRASFRRLLWLVQSNCTFNRVYHMYGQTEMDDRKDIAALFQQGDALVATMVGSASLNLQESNNVVFYDLPWSVGSFIQGAGRIARMNSRFPKKVVHILSAEGTIDEYKTVMVRSNLALIQQVIGGNLTYDKMLAATSKKAIMLMRRQLLWRFGHKVAQTHSREAAFG